MVSGRIVWGPCETSLPVCALVSLLLLNSSPIHQKWERNLVMRVFEIPIGNYEMELDITPLVNLKG